MFNKKYKKGMKDAAKAYEAFGEKQEKALEVILEELRSGNIDIKNAIEKLDGNINALYEYLNSKELAKLYTVYTPFDIKNLKDNEKLFLSGALLKLTMDKVPTDEQQNYLRAVLKYLELKEPPFGVDLFAIENITDNNTQKAIYQTILEYLILQDGDNYDETKMQHEFLESFSLNPHQRQTIAEHVEILYSFTGSIGLSEKYGYVPEEDDFEQDTVESENSIDAEEVSEENVKKSIQLALDCKKFSNDTIIYLKDYIFISTEDSNTLINIKNGDKEEINWLPKNIKTWDYISYKNKCCCVSSIGNLLIDFEKQEHEILSGNMQPNFYPPLIAMDDKYIVMNIFENGETLTTIYNTYTREKTIISVENHERFGCASIINDDILLNDRDVIYKYNANTKQTEKLFTIEDEQICSKLGIGFAKSNGTFVDSLICNNRLYILSKSNNYNEVENHYIYSFDLDSGKNCRCEADNIFVHTSGVYSANAIKKIDNGWLFVTEDSGSKKAKNSKYIMRIFLCDNKQVIKLAENCGYGDYLTDRVPEKWRDYVFFNYYEQKQKKINACVSIKEPMNIIFAKAN